MTIKKTFFTGALFLLLLVPSVSHASALSDFEGWLGGILLGNSLDQTAAVEAAVPPATAWIDIKANKSDGPISITDGLIVALTWTVRDPSLTKDCRISYPGLSGQKSKNVPVTGSEKIVMFPSDSTLNLIAFACKKSGQDVLDIVRITGQQGSVGSAGGGSGAPVGGGFGSQGYSSPVGASGSNSGRSSGSSGTGASVSGIVSTVTNTAGSVITNGTRAVTNTVTGIVNSIFGTNFGGSGGNSGSTGGSGKGGVSGTSGPSSSGGSGAGNSGPSGGTGGSGKGGVSGTNGPSSGGGSVGGGNSGPSGGAGSSGGSSSDGKKDKDKTSDSKN